MEQKEDNLKEVICLIKPQFECGKDIANKYKGIILNKTVHEEVIKNIIENFNLAGFGFQNIVGSPISGGSGNIEYLAYFIKNNKSKNIDSKKIVNEAFSQVHK